MRRIVIAVTAVMCLACAGVASAAVVTKASTSTNNGYKAGFTVGGGAKKNVGVSVVETLGSIAPTGFGVPYPLADIQTKVYGLSSPYAKYFPKCTVAQINASSTFNAICPKDSLVASGTVSSDLSPSTVGTSATGPNPNLTAPTAPCNVDLSVYNAGGGNLAYFFTLPSADACDGLQTGAAAAYPGTDKFSGGYLINNVPEEADISFNAGGAGLWSPLISETLKWNGKVTVKGKSYPFMVSTGCKANKRPWSVTYTGTDYTGAETSPTQDITTSLLPVTVSASSSC